MDSRQLQSDFLERIAAMQYSYSKANQPERQLAADEIMREILIESDALKKFTAMEEVRFWVNSQHLLQNIIDKSLSIANSALTAFLQAAYLAFPDHADLMDLPETRIFSQDDTELQIPKNAETLRCANLEFIKLFKQKNALEKLQGQLVDRKILTAAARFEDSQLLFRQLAQLLASEKFQYAAFFYLRDTVIPKLDLWQLTLLVQIINLEQEIRWTDSKKNLFEKTLACVYLQQLKLNQALKKHPEYIVSTDSDWLKWQIDQLAARNLKQYNRN